MKHKHENKSSEFKEGYNCFLIGVPIENCEYEINSKKQIDWLEGFKQAKKEQDPGK